CDVRVVVLVSLHIPARNVVTQPVQSLAVTADGYPLAVASSSLGASGQVTNPTIAKLRQVLDVRDPGDFLTDVPLVLLTVDLGRPHSRVAVVLLHDIDIGAGLGVPFLALRDSEEILTGLGLRS